MCYSLGEISASTMGGPARGSDPLSLLGLWQTTMPALLAAMPSQSGGHWLPEPCVEVQGSSAMHLITIPDRILRLCRLIPEALAAHAAMNMPAACAPLPCFTHVYRRLNLVVLNLSKSHFC
jgi:hypothetical protein